MGTYVTGTGTLGWWPVVGLGLLAPEISLPKFCPPHLDVAPVLSPACTPPTSLDAFGFFNSVDVRLPFNLISDGSE